MDRRATLPSPAYRVFLSFVLPVLGAFLLSGIVALVLGGAPEVSPDQRGGTALLLAGAGSVSLALGLRWYGLPGLGLRGRRPLYAGIGFATLGWIVFLAARVYLVSSNPDVQVSEDFGLVFLYLLLFEALAVQLWTFGLLFRSIADWRGPLTAGVASGIVFGAVAFLFFGEAFLSSVNSLLYFALWGVLYALIRLRTGSILGAVVVQAMQSLTAWHILLPETRPAPAELHNLYLVAAIFYILIIWRLWPAEQEDYRL